MGRRAKIIGGVLLAVLALGAAYALLVLPDQLAQRQIDRFAASLPKGWSLHHGATHYGLFDRVLRLDDVTLESPQAEPRHADRVVVTGGTGDGSPSAPFRADAVEVAGWSQGGVSVQHLLAADVALRPGALPSFAGLTPMRRLRLALDTATIGRLAVEGERDPAGGAGRIAAEGLGAGRIAHVVVEDARGNQPQTTVQHIEGRDIDVDGLFAVFDPADYHPGKPEGARRKLVGALDAKGVATEDADNRTKLASLHLAGFSGRPFVIAPDPGHTGDPRLGLDIAAALAADAASLEGVSVEPRKDKGSVTFDRFAVNGYDGGKLAGLRVERLVVGDGEHGTVTLGLFELRDLDASRLLAAASGLAAESARTGKPIDQLDLIARSNNTVKLPYFDLRDVAVAPNAGPAITLAGFRGEAAYEGDVVSHLTQTLERLTVPLKSFDLPADMRRLVAAFGRDQVVLGLDLAMSFGPTRLAFDTFRIKADDLGDLRLSAAFGGIDRAKLEAADYPAAFEDATLESAALRYADASLADRLLAVAAARSGSTPEALRRMLIAQAGALPVPALASAVTAFLSKPGVLTIELAPTQAVPLAGLAAMAPEEAARALNLKATAAP